MSTLFLDIEKVYTFDNGDVLAVILSPSGSDCSNCSTPSTPPAKESANEIFKTSSANRNGG